MQNNGSADPVNVLKTFLQFLVIARIVTVFAFGRDPSDFNSWLNINDWLSALFMSCVLTAVQWFWTRRKYPEVFENRS